MKQRPSKLDQFSDQLDQWFGHDKLTLKQVRDKLAAERDFTTTTSGLSSWWQQRSFARTQAEVLARITSGHDTTAKIEKQFGKHPPPELETAIKMLRVVVMELSLHGQKEPELMKLAATLLKPSIELQKMRLKEAELQFSREKWEALEKKAAQAEQAKQVTEAPLTPEEKQDKMKQIFGLA